MDHQQSVAEAVAVRAIEWVTRMIEQPMTADELLGEPDDLVPHRGPSAAAVLVEQGELWAPAGRHKEGWRLAAGCLQERPPIGRRRGDLPGPFRAVWTSRGTRRFGRRGTARLNTAHKSSASRPARLCFPRPMGMGDVPASGPR